MGDAHCGRPGATTIVALDDRDVEERLELQPLAEAISGVVVDDTGAPVLYVTVYAAQRVTVSAGTDAAGHFSISALPAGACAVWADCFGLDEVAMLRRVETTTGDTRVRVELPRTGAITGTAVLAATSTPPTALRVRACDCWEVLAVGGAFTMRELAAGDVTLSFHGREFVDTGRTARVEPGAVTEVGTVVLERGRTVSGVVVDGAGDAIAGAKVTIGMSPFSAFDEVSEDRFGYRSTTSDERGAFSIGGVESVVHAAVPIVAGADHPRHGRSEPTAIPGGVGDPPPLVLVLGPCGSIAGTVTRDGAPLVRALVGCDWPEIACTELDGAGTFVLPRVRVGSHVLRTVLDDCNFGSHATRVEVLAGARTTVTIDVPVGTITLAVATDHLPPVDLFLFSDTHIFANRVEMQARLWSHGQGMAQWRDDLPPAFDGIVPGDYTLCTIRARESDEPDEPVHCMTLHVADTPAKQTVVVKLGAR